MMEASSPAIPLPPSTRLPTRFGLLGDEWLARLVAGGNHRAFAALYERYHQPLYRYCRSIVRNESDAQDALQSAFASAFAALRRGQRDAPMRPWLFRIVHNEAISLIRRRPAGEELGGGAERCAVSAEDRFAQRDELASSLADLRELPERQRGALVMRELSGMSHQEIAVALGTSVAAAKQAIFEARGSLLEFAEGRAMACDEVLRAISDGDRRMLRGRRPRAHLRDCESCAAFAAAIPARSAELRALVPALTLPAAAGVFARAVGSASIHGAGSSGGAGNLAAAAAGKFAGASVASKALLCGAVVATTAGGIADVIVHRSHPLHGLAAARLNRTAPITTRAHRTGQAPAPRAIGTSRGREDRAHRGLVAGPAAKSASSAKGHAAGQASARVHAAGHAADRASVRVRAAGHAADRASARVRAMSHIPAGVTVSAGSHGRSAAAVLIAHGKSHAGATAHGRSHAGATAHGKSHARATEGGPPASPPLTTPRKARSGELGRTRGPSSRGQNHRHAHAPDAAPPS